jgi:hypothetical protein
MRASRLILLLVALTLLALGDSLARAETVTFNYNFTGPVAVNPGPFSPTSSPAPSITVVYPTVSAAPGAMPGSSAVTQSPLGLGIFTDPPGGGMFNTNVESLGGAVVDAQGSVFYMDTNNSPAELINLNFTNTDGLLTNFVITGLQLGYINIGNQVDFSVDLDGSFYGNYDFPTLGAGNAILPLNIPITGNTFQLSLTPHSPIVDNSNAFTVMGLQVQAIVSPEPISMLAWGTISAIGAASAWRYRRRNQKSETPAV